MRMRMFALLDKAKSGTDIAAVKPTAVQVTKLPV
jgi:hypothetical protein